MPIDLNLLRTDRGGDPAKVRKSEVDRYRDTKFIDELIAADEKWRKMKYSLDTKKYEVGKISKAVAEKKKASKGKDPCDEERAQAKVMNEEIEGIKVEVAEAEKKVNDLQGKIGNILSPNVPIFKDGKDNQVIDTWGEPKKIDIDGKTLGRMHHHEIMHCLDIADLERGSKISGHRGYFLKGMGVLLN
jgi:seryl-tRNA synthetase